MVHVPFNPESIKFETIVFQRGRGEKYRGFRQRGAGLGDFFATLWRYAQPILKEIGREAALTGARILTDAGQGQSIKKVAVKHSKKGASNLLQKAALTLNNQGGTGRKKGSIKHKRKASTRLFVKNPPIKIRNKKDIFGIY